MTDIANNWRSIIQRIAAAGQGRNVRLVAVSKTKSIEAVRAAIAMGQRCFGENRVQEAKTKFIELRAEYPDLELHLIGALQTNKALEAVKLFDVIETLDRPELALALSKAIAKAGRTPQLYIEVNIGSEPQKAGVLEKDLAGFLSYARNECGLTVSGLMCIPPQQSDAAPYFKRMRDLATQHQLPHLSMGMSNDFETAIKCGATAVRVGSALFGERSVN